MTTTSKADPRAHVAFHLTGVCMEKGLESIEELRPALFASYRDLASLRYDFPVVLLRNPSETPFVSLSGAVDAVFEKLNPAAADGERVRKILLRHEQAIRRLVASGTTGTLRQLWGLAQSKTEDAAANEILTKGQTALTYDGRVLDFDATMCVRLFIRTWRFVQDRKIRRARAELDRLILKIKDILRADSAASDLARTPQQLKASIGTAFEGAFDFGRMSTILSKAPQPTGLSESRRLRLENVVKVLETQQFFRTEHAEDDDSQDGYVFLHTSCAAVAEAYRERTPAMVELAKAMAIADLEAKGEYSETQHDALFEAFGTNGLTTEELAQFPDYLLWLPSPSAEDYGDLMALLGSSVPVKVLVPFDDLLEEAPGGKGDLTLSLRSKQLADLAIGLNSVYVLQSPASNLVQMRDAVVKGLTYGGPALFSIYTGAQPGRTLPQYLVSAAAMESRAFPAFTFDPAAGTDWAARFSVDANPQADRDWPVQKFAYEDATHGRVACDVAFTLADFMACDARYARHYAKVPAADCNGNMVTVQDWIARNATPSTEQLPAVMMVDGANVLQRAIVDSKAVEEAKRCRSIWRSLQELGGINNSHAQRLLARERVRWEEEKQREIDALLKDAKPAGASAPPVAAPVAAQTSAAPAPVAEPAAQEEKSSDEAYIETPRCTTCEECVQVNNKMFVYDANKQAYIADINAGTYRQLVEAAEACQVSIIHPGKPRNANEPGIAELVERAAAFQ